MTLLELRKKPGKILDAVSHNEEVIISNRGKDVARVVSLSSREEGPLICAENHDAYGIWKDKQDDLPVADALIAAAAVENCEVLLTGNNKHFRIIQELDLKQFRP